MIMLIFGNILPNFVFTRPTTKLEKYIGHHSIEWRCFWYIVVGT